MRGRFFQPVLHFRPPGPVRSIPVRSGLLQALRRKTLAPASSEALGCSVFRSFPSAPSASPPSPSPSPSPLAPPPLSKYRDQEFRCFRGFRLGAGRRSTLEWYSPPLPQMRTSVHLVLPFRVIIFVGLSFFSSGFRECRVFHLNFNPAAVGASPP